MDIITYWRHTHLPQLQFYSIKIIEVIFLNFVYLMFHFSVVLRNKSKSN